MTGPHLLADNHFCQFDLYALLMVILYNIQGNLHPVQEPNAHFIDRSIVVACCVDVFYYYTWQTSPQSATNRWRLTLSGSTNAQD